MKYTVDFKPAAARQIRKLPKATQNQIIKHIEILGENPFPAGVVKLAGEDDLFRIRVGDYRVIYSVENKKLVVLVVSVGHRREVYRRRF